jgi:hypothetical protein
MKTAALPPPFKIFPPEKDQLETRPCQTGQQLVWPCALAEL